MAKRNVIPLMDLWREKKPQGNTTKYAAIFANRLWEIFYSVYNQNADIGWHKFRMYKQRREKQEKGRGLSRVLYNLWTTRKW